MWPSGSRSVVAAVAIFGAMAASSRQVHAESPAPDASPEAPAEDDPARWLKELDVEAGVLEADLRLRELDLREGVRLRLPPYYLRSERIHLSFSRLGVRVAGGGLLTFCPCGSPPLSIGFSGGYAAPPHELIVENPTLRFFGVPIFWLPYLWLRSPHKIGLTVPDVAYRGADGLFLGQGIHLPIGRGLELAGGLYTQGGYAATVDFGTERSVTLIRFDQRSAPNVGGRVASGVGLAVDARGELGLRPALAPEPLPRGTSNAPPQLMWDLDAIRGARGLRTTTDLEPLARPIDRGETEARLGPMSIGVEGFDPRGGPLDRVEEARAFTSLGGRATLPAGGGALHGVFGPRFLRGRRADVVGDADTSLVLGGLWGITQWTATTRLDGRLAEGGGTDREPRARAGALAGETALEAAVPFARALRFARAAGGPPVIHVVEPVVRAVAVGALGGGVREALEGFAPLGALDLPPVAPTATGVDVRTRTRGAVLATMGVRTSLGAIGGGIAPGLDPWTGKLVAEVMAGPLVTASRRDTALAGRLAYDTHHGSGGGAHIALEGAIARSIDGGAATTAASVGPPSGATPRELAWIALATTRYDTSRDGFGVELRGALRGDIAVIAGWALLGADVAPRLVSATGLATPGATLGFGAGFPLGFGLRLGGDVDAYGASMASFGDGTALHLLDVRGTLRYRHPCGCFRFGLRGGHVVGRPGIDLFAVLELAQRAPDDPRSW